VDYSVGQVLYALSNKEMAVIPLRVTERILRETLDGEVVSYVAKTAGGKQVEDLSKLSATFFTTADDVKVALVENVTRVVQQIVDNASQTASQAFGESESSRLKTNIDKPVQETLKEDEKSITLPDGTVAKVKIPDSLMGQ
jgi:hypothetical protein